MKKAVLILTIVVTAVIAWIIAFPNNNPITKLFASSATKSDGSLLNTSGQAINTGKTQSGSFLPSSPVVTDSYGFPLHIGSSGQYVEWMQAGLNNYWGAALDIDGIFGQKTYNALAARGFNPDAVSTSEYLTIVNG